MKVFFLLILFSLNNLWSSTEKPIGRLTKVNGKVILINTVTKQETIAENGSKVFNYYSIQTLKNSKAKLILKNGTIINIAKDTLFEVEKLNNEKDNTFNSSIKLFYGKIRSIVRPTQDKNMTVQTPAAVMGVRGTDFFTVFKRNFKTQSSESSVYTISGSVALKRKHDLADQFVLVPAGNFSTIFAKNDGSTDKPTEPILTPPDIINQLKSDMIAPEKTEKDLSVQKNSLLSLIQPSDEPETLENSIDSQEVAFEESSADYDATENKTEIETNDLKGQETIASRAEPIIDKPSINKTIATTKVVTSKTDSTKNEKTLPSANNENNIIKDPQEPKDSSENENKIDFSLIHKSRFNIDTWAKYNGWMIVNDILEKNENKSLIRFIRHANLSEKNKKLTKLTTLNAIFYDKNSISNNKLTPTPLATKVTAKAFSEEKKFKGYEIEFFIEPGTYLVSIDNGPVSQLIIEPMKDITVKTSVFLSPGSEYSIFNPLTKSLIPFRNKGNPIFALPGSYRISKKIKNTLGIFTGKTKVSNLKIDPNSITTPSF